MIFLKHYIPQFVVALLVLVFLLSLLLLNLQSRLAQVNKLVRSLLTGPSGENLETMLTRCLSESRQALARGEEFEARLQSTADAMRGCVQHIGLVRYDAYGDVSGAQSFSIALLDDHHNGAILTGLLGRHDGRCYGKPVANGQTEMALSEEEESALQMALHGGINAPAVVATGRNGKREKGVLNRG